MDDTIDLINKVVLSFNNIYDHAEHLYDVSRSFSVHGPRVETETKFIKWYKMVALYIVWGWVAFICPQASFWTLMINDGGVFYNECYYMFYNGVVWYNPPKAYIPGIDPFAVA